MCEAMSDEVRHRHNSLLCDVLKESLDNLVDIRCKLECSIVKLKAAQQKTACSVDMNLNFSPQKYSELLASCGDKFKKLAALLSEHVRKHEVHTGRKEVDSGYVHSATDEHITENCEQGIGEIQGSLSELNNLNSMELSTFNIPVESDSNC